MKEFDKVKEEVESGKWMIIQLLSIEEYLSHWEGELCENGYVVYKDETSDPNESFFDKRNSMLIMSPRDRKLGFMRQEEITPDLAVLVREYINLLRKPKGSGNK